MHIKYFFTSDWHLNHTNILKFAQRPFDTIEEMHDSLIRRYNASVPADAICFFLGDMGDMNKGNARDMLFKLNGRKVLILGNHDKGVLRYLNSGFDSVMLSSSLWISNSLVTLSHYPLLGVQRENTSFYKGREHEHWFKEDQFSKFALHDHGQFHLHGHIHSENGGKSKKILDRQFDVGVDANNFTPVSLSTIESWINRFKGVSNASSDE